MELEEAITRLRDAVNEGELVFGEKLTSWRPGERSKPHKLVVPAEAIGTVGREALSGGHSLPIIGGAVIEGGLDLNFCELHGPLYFLHCLFTGPVELMQARLGNVQFHDCEFIDQHEGYALYLDRAAIAGNLGIVDCRFTAGGLSLMDTRIGGQLHLARTEIADPPDGAALAASRMSVGADSLIDSCRTSGSFLLDETSFDGSLRVRGTRLDQTWQADHMVLSRGSLRFEGENYLGAASFDNASIEHELDMTDVKAGQARPISISLENSKVGPLTLDGIQTERSVSVADSVIDGSLEMERATIGGLLRSSLVASGVVVKDNLDLMGSKFHGMVNLASAKVGGKLILRRTEILEGSTELPPEWAAAAADAKGRSRTDETLPLQDVSNTSVVAVDAYVGGGVDISGASLDGCLTLNGLTVGGQVMVVECESRGASPEGFGLQLDRGKIDGTVALTGSSFAGSGRFVGTKFGGDLNIVDSKFGRSSEDSALSLYRASVAAGVRLHSIECYAPLTLSALQVGGSLSIEPVVRNGTAYPLLIHAPRLVVGLGTTIDAGDAKFLEYERATLGPFAVTSARTQALEKSDLAEYSGDEVPLINLSRSRLNDLTVLGFGPSLNLRSASLDHLEIRQGPVVPTLVDAEGFALVSVDAPFLSDPRALSAWLADGANTAQPYHEVAAALDRQGLSSEARRLRYLGALKTTALTTSKVQRAGRGIYRATTGHGYYPLRSLLWLAGVFMFSAVLAIATADSFTINRGTATSSTSIVRPDADRGNEVVSVGCNDSWQVACFDAIEFAYVNAVPVADSTQAWTPADGWVGVAFALARIAAWVLGALFLAGVTGLLRQQT